jgi:hypothetical protein
MKYLQGTRTLSLTFGGKSPVAKLHAYADADWGRSRSGHVIYLCDSPIMWSSKLQVSPALSSTEAEYVALSSAAREVLWCRNFLQELGLGQNDSSVIFIPRQQKLHYYCRVVPPTSCCKTH